MSGRVSWKARALAAEAELDGGWEQALRRAETAALRNGYWAGYRAGLRDMAFAGQDLARAALEEQDRERQHDSTTRGQSLAPQE